MINYIEILKANPRGVLATHDGAKIKTRVLSAFFTEDDKIYFTTSSEKAVYTQIRENPNVSFCVYLQNRRSVISIYGKVNFIDDLNLKARLMEANPILKGDYSTPDNPVYVLFNIEISEIEMYNHGEGKKTYNLNV